MKRGDLTRYLQGLRLGSEEWARVYGYDRNAVERLNSIVKDAAREDLENSARRRSRGFTAAALFTAFSLVSVNRRLTTAWERSIAERELLNRSPRRPHFTAKTIKHHRQRHLSLAKDGTITQPERRPIKTHPGKTKASRIAGGLRLSVRGASASSRISRAPTSASVTSLLG